MENDGGNLTNIGTPGSGNYLCTYLLVFSLLILLSSIAVPFQGFSDFLKPTYTPTGTWLARGWKKKSDTCVIVDR